MNKKLLVKRQEKRLGGRRSPAAFLSLAGSLLLLSSCSGLDFFPSKSNTKVHGSGGDVRREKLATDVNINDARDIASSASSAEGFSTEAPQTSIGSEIGRAPFPQNIVDTQSSLLQSKGLNVERLFDENLRSDNKRFDRLEESVQNIHNYVAEISPSVERLVAIESDIEALVSQLEVLLSENHTSSAPAHKQASPQQKNMLSPVTKKAATVKKNTYAIGTLANVRASSDPSKTRVVFELSEKMNFSYDLDNSEKILSVFFPDAKSSSMSLSAIKRMKLFDDATVTQQDGGGYVVALSLSRATSLVNQGRISPNRDNPMYRIFMDFE